MSESAARSRKLRGLIPREADVHVMITIDSVWLDGRPRVAI